MTNPQLLLLQAALNQVQNLMQAQQGAPGGQGILGAPALRQPTKESLENAQRAIADALKSFK
jgi:hypothetical protein